MLNEIHLLPDSAFSDNVVVGLKDLKLQLAQHPRHKVGVRIGKQRHGGHKLTAIEVDNFLVEEKKQSVGQINEIMGGILAINNSVIFTYDLKNELGTV